MAKKILITGATGFVGSRLATYLLQLGYEVHVTIRSSSNLWRLAPIQHQLHIHSLDLMQSQQVATLILSIQPDWIYHCACYGGLVDETDEQQILNVNIIATLHLLNAAVLAGVERFIAIGSSSEYGIKDQPMQETDLERPMNLYGISKLTASHLVRLFGATGKIKSTVLRIFSPYGKYDDPRRLIPTVINACLRCIPLKLGSGRQVRDFVYVDDIVTAFVSAALRAPGQGEIINLGSGQQTSVLDMVNLILAECHHPIAPIWGDIPDRNHEPKHWAADISQANKLLNWQPQTNLQHGLRQTIEWSTQQLVNK